MAKVLHLTNTEISDDARILRELAAVAACSEWEIYGVGVRGSANRGAPPGVSLSGIHVRTLGWKWVPRAVRYALSTIELTTRFVAAAIRVRPDLVHCHDTMALPAGWLVKRLTGSLLVYDAHELESAKGGQSPALARATWWIERRIWARIDAFITVSPSIQNWYMERLGDSQESICLLNSPSLGDALEAGADSKGLRQKLGLGPDTALFVYVGALVPGRGVEFLLETFAAESPDVHLAFVGSGELEGLVRARGSRMANVHYVDPVPHDELVNFIRYASGAFCLIEDVSLSDHYCLPNKLFEYAFAGLPVIASRLPDIQLVVEQYELGTCADMSTESLRAAVERCLSAIAIDRAPDLPRLAPLSAEAQGEKLRGLYRRLFADRGGVDAAHDRPAVGGITSGHRVGS